MKWVTYLSAVVAILSAVCFTALIFLPLWDPYVAHASLDFSRVDAVTGNFTPNYTTSSYLLRIQVVIFVWICAVAYFIYGAYFDHRYPKKTQAENVNPPKQPIQMPMVNVSAARLIPKPIPATSSQTTKRPAFVMPNSPHQLAEKQDPEKLVEDQTRTSSDFYLQYVNAYWVGLILASLLEGFIISVLCGINTISLNLLIGVILAFVFVLIGPAHNCLNKIIAPDKQQWIAYTLGVIVFVVYSFLTLIYLIEAQVIGPGNVHWSIWSSVFGCWVSKLAIVVAQSYYWKKQSKKGVVYTLFFAHLFSLLWLPWMFFARTVTYIP